MNRNFARELYQAGMGIEIGGGPAGGVNVGDSVNVVTPSQFRLGMERTRNLIDALARDIAASADRLAPAWKAGWTDFLLRWGGFYDAHPEGWQDTLASASSLVGPWTTIADFAAEARQWRLSFVQAGGQSTPMPDAAPTPPTFPNPLRAGASPFVWGLLGLGAIVGLILLKREG